MPIALGVRSGKSVGYGWNFTPSSVIFRSWLCENTWNRASVSIGLSHP
jgi:hypothetical protein